MNDLLDRQKKIGITGLPQEGSQHLDTGSIDWQGGKAEGFYYKSLLQDQSNGIRSWLMKVDPGGFSPMHAHGEIEQIYVLEGSIYDQDKTYAQGQYVVRAPGTMHTTGSKTGAIVLLFYSSAKAG